MQNDEAAKRLAAEILSRTRLKSRWNEGEDRWGNIHESDRVTQIESP
jgi:hypothetical protein